MNKSISNTPEHLELHVTISSLLMNDAGTEISGAKQEEPTISTHELVTLWIASASLLTLPVVMPATEIRPSFVA